MITKQFRVTIYIENNEIEGKWRNYDEKEFEELCKTYADNETCFTVEFRLTKE